MNTDQHYERNVLYSEYVALPKIEKSLADFVPVLWAAVLVIFGNIVARIFRK